MKIISTNIGNATTILWRGKEEKSGIFKYPITGPIYLGTTDVVKDTVTDRKHHAGINKACFLFSADQYPFWKNQYPDLPWDWGMFGENLTVEGLNESEIRVGDVYRVGTAVIQISQPREPCYKLGIRFKNQAIVKQYIDHGYSGTYVRVLEKGSATKGDDMVLVKQSDNPLTVKQLFDLINARKKDPGILKLALENESVPQYKRERLKKYL
ncbi:MOSC domain-containing protein [Flavobacteriaceae bacterium F89]|uniref:MOSC domain-containing protein n=1 Tax=Cerina litoralis TaxID=2874477 RepID=A0AAE3EWW1_9FLAO|nr:MOSC domain-containing protein [Cerina litoralis]MCG2461201.1 MOSC domain-containing protein [Cerina litoralis]